MEPQQILAKGIADPLGQTIHLIDSIQQALRFEGSRRRSRAAAFTDPKAVLRSRSAMFRLPLPMATPRSEMGPS